MTTNEARAAILMRALRASIAGDRGAVNELYTDDVKAWAPALSASSAAELAAEFEHGATTPSRTSNSRSPLSM